TMTPAGTMVVHGVLRTPSTGMPVIQAPPREVVVQLRGQPTAKELTGELMQRLGAHGLERLVVDLDSAEILDDDLAPVLPGARAAARAAHVELVIRATRTGAKRWLTRLELDEETGR